jgi:hypothetical protein
MRRLAIVLIALAPATSAFAFNPQPDPPAMLGKIQTQTIRMGDGSVRLPKVHLQNPLDAVGLNPQPLPPKVLLLSK